MSPERKLTHLDLQQQRQIKPRPSDLLLTAAQIDADLDLLGYALDRGYGGRGFVPEKDWERLEARLRALKGQPRTVASFCDEVADALWQVPDAHLSAKLQSTTDSSSSKCGPLARDAKRVPSAGSNYAAEDKRPWAAEILSSGQATFGVIAIKSFPTNDDPAWAGFDGVVKNLSRNDGIIVDLRGNGGGDDSRAYQLAQALVDGPVSTGVIRTHRRQTPETVTLWLNTLDRMGRDESGVLAPHLAKMYGESEAERAAIKPLQPKFKVDEEPPFTLKLGPSAFKGPIAILVDEGCDSSCESGLEVLRLHPNAKVFGRRTGGYIHFGNVGRLGLPNSGIRVGIPTKYNEYPAGQFYDKVGFEPDVIVAPGTDAFNQAMTWLMPQVPAAKPVSAQAFSVPQAARDAERQRLIALGLTVPRQEFPSKGPLLSPTLGFPTWCPRAG